MAAFYTEGLCFECQRCSSCCGKVPRFVYLSKRDLLTLSRFYSIHPVHFVMHYCRWADYYHGTTVLALKEKSNHDCILWNNGCEAYPARPLQCSTYPFWTWMLKDRETWDDCAKDCPGMNRGKWWSPGKSAELSHRFSENIPLQKEDFSKMFPGC